MSFGVRNSVTRLAHFARNFSSVDSRISSWSCSQKHRQLVAVKVCLNNITASWCSSLLLSSINLHKGGRDPSLTCQRVTEPSAHMPHPPKSTGARRAPTRDYWSPLLAARRAPLSTGAQSHQNSPVVERQALVLSGTSFIQYGLLEISVGCKFNKATCQLNAFQNEHVNNSRARLIVRQLHSARL